MFGSRTRGWRKNPPKTNIYTRYKWGGSQRVVRCQRAKHEGMERLTAFVEQEEVDCRPTQEHNGKQQK